MAEMRSINDRPHPDSRLVGWKEIAAHFDRGVRTVQRWEKEFGLPVRRLPGGRNDSVTASTNELDAWWRDMQQRTLQPSASDDDEEAAGKEGWTDGAAAAMAAPATEPTPSAAIPGFRRHPAAWIAGLGLLVIAVITGGGFWWRYISVDPRRNPATCRFEGDSVFAYSAAGERLWRAPVAEKIPPPGPFYGSPAVTGDVDGDGWREVFVREGGDDKTPGRVHCFNADGSLRWTHTVATEARFGGIAYGGQWQAHFIATTEDERGRSTLWAGFNHYNYFPSVLQKLDETGKVRGEYWSDGQFDDVKAGVLNGRRSVFVSGSNNEWRGGSLAILDEADPTATAPAVTGDYVCQTCPKRAPLVFLVFPPSPIETALSNTSAPVVHVDARQNVTVEVRHNADLAGPGHPAYGQTTYWFDSSLRPLRAVREPSYKIVHDAMFALEKIDHPFGRADEASAWPIHRWTGKGFEDLWPARK